MQMVSIFDAVKALCPNAGFACGSTYDSLSWQDADVSKPTEDEVNAKRDELEKLYPMKELRRQRDLKLVETDKYALPDWPHADDAARQAWLVYRQALRDLPANTADPGQEIVWPQIPV